jgi:hypothetical protein
MPALAGRGFGPTDGPGGARVALVNAAMASHFWPGRSAVGKHSRHVWQKQSRTIVGVVGDVRSEELGKSPAWDFYIPFAQEPRARMALAIRPAGDPEGLGGVPRRAVAAVNPNVPVSKVRGMECIVADSMLAWPSRPGRRARLGRLPGRRPPAAQPGLRGEHDRSAGAQERPLAARLDRAPRYLGARPPRHPPRPDCCVARRLTFSMAPRRRTRQQLLHDVDLGDAVPRRGRRHRQGPGLLLARGAPCRALC